MKLKSLAAVVIGLSCALPLLAQDQDPAAAPPASAAPAGGEPGLETIPVSEGPAEPDTAANPGAVTLDTIEVTAQRRKQRLVDVPVAVTAMTQDQVEARGIQRLDDLNSLAPGLQVSRSPANTTISQLTIRGSSQINPAIYWDPAVGVYLDGVYIGKAQGSIFNIVDIAGVEVLRGPQGTLYGRNTIAGTINFITREPSGIFSGRAGIEYGNLNAQVLHASMDLPRLAIADITLGVRSERRDPWVTTTPTSPTDGMNNRHNDGAHFATVLDIAPGVEALYRLDWSETDQTNTALQLVRSDDANLQPYVAKKRRPTADLNAPSAELAKVQGHSLSFTWEFNETNSIKAITGYRKVKWVDKLDLDGSPRDTARSQRHTDYEQLSQDLNVSGSGSLWNYTAGVYYFEDDGFTNNPIYVELMGAPLDFDSRYGAQSKAWAGYGQFDWRPLEPLTVAAGARYTTEKKDLDRVWGFRSNQSQPYNYYMPEGYRAPGATFTATTPMASVAWRFNPQLNVYARYAEGFKSGGFNGEYSDFIPPADAQSNQRETNTPFRPEKQKSIELGAKTSFLDGKALVNVAAFHNKLEDLQVSIFTASGAAATVVRNAGKATVRGVEVETAFVPFEGTQLRLNYAYLDPVYDEFIDAGQNVADNRAFVHAPETSYNAVLDSELWSTNWGTLRAVTDYVWTDEFYTYPYQLQTVDTGAQTAGNTLVQAYGLLNARLSFTGIPLGSARLGELMLWGRNLLDEDAANNFIDFGPDFQNLTIANFVEPRTVGVSALLRW